MDAAALEELVASRAGDLPFRVLPGAREHPQIPSLAAVSAFEKGPDGALELYAGSFEALAGQAPELEPAALVDRLLSAARARREEDAAAAASMPLDKSLFEAHAAFLADREVPLGWYRRGEPLGQGLWAVDLDVFLEVVLPEDTWAGLRGGPVALHVQGEVFEIELPEDAALEECWTLPECGLFEEEAGVRLDDLEPDDEVPGRFGDLHLFPVVL